VRTKLTAAAIGLALLGLLAGGTTLASAASNTQARTAWGVPVSSASAPAAAPAEVLGTGPDITTAKTIVVLSRNETDTNIDNPPAGFSQGDELVVTSPLFNRAGTRLGRLDVHGVITSAVPPDPSRGFAVQWVFTASLSRGQITAQGVQTEDLRFTAAVTGGTGVYQNARGQVVVRFLANATRLTYQLIP
jgi:allene oxide cyclase